MSQSLQCSDTIPMVCFECSRPIAQDQKTYYTMLEQGNTLLSAFHTIGYEKERDCCRRHYMAHVPRVQMRVFVPALLSIKILRDVALQQILPYAVKNKNLPHPFLVFFLIWVHCRQPGTLLEWNGAKIAGREEKVAELNTCEDYYHAARRSTSWAKQPQRVHIYRVCMAPSDVFFAQRVQLESTESKKKPVVSVAAYDSFATIDGELKAMSEDFSSQEFSSGVTDGRVHPLDFLLSSKCSTHYTMPKELPGCAWLTYIACRCFLKLPVAGISKRLAQESLTKQVESSATKLWEKAAALITLLAKGVARSTIQTLKESTSQGESTVVSGDSALETDTNLVIDDWNKFVQIAIQHTSSRFAEAITECASSAGAHFNW